MRQLETVKEAVRLTILKAWLAKVTATEATPSGGLIC